MPHLDVNQTHMSSVGKRVGEEIPSDTAGTEAACCVQIKTHSSYHGHTVGIHANSGAVGMVQGNLLWYRRTYLGKY